MWLKQSFLLAVACLHSSTSWAKTRGSASALDSEYLIQHLEAQLEVIKAQSQRIQHLDGELEKLSGDDQQQQLEQENAETRRKLAESSHSSSSSSSSSPNSSTADASSSPSNPNTSTAVAKTTNPSSSASTSSKASLWDSYDKAARIYYIGSHLAHKRTKISTVTCHLAQQFMRLINEFDGMVNIEVVQEVCEKFEVNQLLRNPCDVLL